jgi:hypothetical protein
MEIKTKIYLHDHDEVSVEKAIEILTDEWIEEGNICYQTVMDLRDALKEALSQNKGE